MNQIQFGMLEVEIHSSSEAAGIAAAQATAQAMRELSGRKNEFAIIFATGASQLATLDALTEMTDLPWNQVTGFHMDEYVGIGVDHKASFRRYLREQLTNKVAIRGFFEIEGDSANPKQAAVQYAEKVRAARPEICLLGVGENGHLAFNDPFIADFQDPLDTKIVRLDSQCRHQQVAEGWFENDEKVPPYAITLTVPALLRVPRLIVSVPGPRKAKIVRRVLEDPISTACPATILRTHPNATMYLDPASASELPRTLFAYNIPSR